MAEKYITINSQRYDLKYRNILSLSQISFNSFKDIEHIENCKNIKHMDINRCQIQSLDGIQFFPDLEKLYLQKNSIEKLAHLDSLVKLKEIDISYNKITKIENLSTLVNLEKLDLTKNQVAKIENLDHLPNLKKLNLSYNKIAKIENLETLPHLQSLDLRHNKIKGVENLDYLQSLLELHLGGNPPEENFSNLNAVTNLKVLELPDGLRTITDVSHLLKLESISMGNLSDMFKISGFEQFPRLKEIDFYIQDSHNFKMDFPELLVLFRFASIVKSQKFDHGEWKSVFDQFPTAFFKFSSENSADIVNWYLYQCSPHLEEILDAFRETADFDSMGKILRKAWGRTLKIIDNYFSIKPEIVNFSAIAKVDDGMSYKWQD